MSKLILIIACLWLSGCATYSKNLDSAKECMYGAIYGTLALPALGYDGYRHICDHKEALR